MRRWLMLGVLLLVACREDPPRSTSPAPSTSTSTSTSPSTSTSTSPSPSEPTADAADCARVAPCADAFAAVAPSELAGPARIAAEQLDQSLVESPARAAACSAALASFRADLERLEIEIPEACRPTP